MRRVVSLFLTCWATDRLRLQSGAAPDARPLLMAERRGARRVVTAVDARARALGLYPGMAVAQAQAMQPGLRIEQADQAADKAGLSRLAAWCLRHVSPLAAPCPPDGVFIDATGCTHLFGPGEAGEMALLRFLTERLSQAGIAARAAMADTPGAAHALARHGASPLCVAPPGSTRAILAPLPVAALRLPEEVVQALKTLGFEAIGQLMAAPRAPLTKRFGSLVLRRLDQALGQAKEPIEPLLVRDIPRTRMGFPDPIATAEDLARATMLLTERLCEKLLQRGLGASRLDLVFTRVDGVAQSLRIGTASPSRDPVHLARLLCGKIETIDPGFGIEAMFLAAPATASLGARQIQSELCAQTAMPDFSGLIDALANRLGQEKVFSLAPVESDVPERSVRRIPPLSRQDMARWPDHLPRPPRLFTPPQRIEALSLLPDHAPKQFLWRRRAYRVRHADGPERIFGEWWKHDAETWAVRDYFAVEDQSGQRFWLFRRGDGEAEQTGDLRWFLHGLFG